MRWFAVVLGLAVGLFLSVLVFGQVGHLRMLLPERLPNWTDTMTARSGMLTGQARIAEGSSAGAFDLQWNGMQITPNGPSWRLRLRGGGIEGDGRVLLGPVSRQVVTDAARLDADLAIISALQGVANVTGSVQLSVQSATFDLDSNRVERLEATGRALAIVISGLRLGEGNLSVRTDLSGSWRVTADLTGPDLHFSGTITTVPGQRLARIEGTGRPGIEITDAQRALLDTLFQRDGDGSWQIAGEVRF